MRWTVPNILTTLRLICAPAVAIMFLYFNRPYADWFALALFAAAGATDWIDGRLARAWGQETQLGAMLDPIADKAMVVIALLVITGFSGMNPWILIPSTLILFREVFVSGLREFLGSKAGTLKVTRLAKWKTTAQMVAIAVLFANGAVEHYFGMLTLGMGDDLTRQVIDGTEEDIYGVRRLYTLWDITWYGGIILLWAAGVLTLITGADYFLKAWKHLKEDGA